MKVLVTGASGFIGKCVCRALLLRGHQVRAAVRRPLLPEHSASGDQVVLGEIHGGTAWATAVDGMDAVVHLAGRAHVPRRESRSIEVFRRVNVEGAVELLKAAQTAGVRRFVNVSSISVLGLSSGAEPFSERSPLRPCNAYAQTKLEAEQALAALARTTELVTVRPPLVYGPHGRGNMLRLLRLARSRIPLPFGRALGERDMIGIDNLVDILLLCAELPELAGQTYVVRDGEPVSTAELTRMLRRKLGIRPMLLPVPHKVLAAAAGMVGRSEEVARLFQPLRIDDHLFRQHSGWSPNASLSEGLDRTIAWFNEAEK